MRIDNEKYYDYCYYYKGIDYKGIDYEVNYEKICYMYDSSEIWYFKILWDQKERRPHRIYLLCG